MISKKGILARLQSIVKSGQASFDKRMTHPVREWMIGLAFFSIIVAVGATHNALVFVNYRNINTEEGTYGQSVTHYNATLVQKVIGIYRERKTAYDALQTEAASALDEVAELPAAPVATSSKNVEEEGGEVMMAI
jgi:hypothetical protein